MDRCTVLPLSCAIPRVHDHHLLGLERETSVIDFIIDARVTNSLRVCNNTSLALDRESSHRDYVTTKSGSYNGNIFEI